MRVNSEVHQPFTCATAAFPRCLAEFPITVKAATSIDECLFLMEMEVNTFHFSVTNSLLKGGTKARKLS